MTNLKSDNLDLLSNKSDSISQAGPSRTPLGLVAYGDDEEGEEQVDSPQPESHTPPFSRSIAQSGIETLASTSSLPLAGSVAELRREEGLDSPSFVPSEPIGGQTPTSLDRDSSPVTAASSHNHSPVQLLAADSDMEAESPVPSPGPDQPSVGSTTSKRSAERVATPSFEDETEPIDTDIAEQLRRRAAVEAKRRRKDSEEHLTQDSATWLSRSVRDLKADDVGIPGEPRERCPPVLQERITRQLLKFCGRPGASARADWQSLGLGPVADYNALIQARRDFRNPSIYEKLVQLVGIDEKGTNFPPDVYNPTLFGPESFYDELARIQKVEMEKLERQRRERTRVELVTATASRARGAVGGAGAVGAALPMSIASAVAAAQAAAARINASIPLHK